ncbi:MAG: hypothetical protein ACKOYN_06465 [Planctomycetota bacterium]
MERSDMDAMQGAQRPASTISANDKRVVAEGDHEFVESGEGGIRTHE